MTPPSPETILAMLDDMSRWRAHGIGMIRAYYGPDIRVNVWHDCLVNEGISTMHTHPWPLRSTVLAGELHNIRWHRLCDDPEFLSLPGPAVAMAEGTISCGDGPFSGIEGKIKKTIVAAAKPERLLPGDSYTQEPHEIHTTAFRNGTVTLMQKGPELPGCKAQVLWPYNEPFGDASRQLNFEDFQTVRLAAIVEMAGL